MLVLFWVIIKSMAQDFKIEGIYDQRTLKLLKQKGLRDFGFNFSPRSFNFIQEHIFLSDLIPLLDPLDRIHLHFDRSNDPMIKKVLEDLKKAGFNPENVYIDCDEWSERPETMGVKYYLTYHPELDISQCRGENFSGMIFNFSYFEELHQRNVLNNFISNFYTHFSKVLTDDKKIVLRMDWNSNIMPSLFDYFEFDLMSFSINSKIEVCYRNVDLKKLTTEMDLIKKNTHSLDNF